MRVFVDYDGTITDRDTFDLLVQVYAGAPAWDNLEERLETGEVTLRQTLAAQAALLKCTFEQADETVASMAHFDPAFAPFVAQCERAGVPVTILSCGLGPLIERALARNGLERVPLLSNGAVPDPNGWRMAFRDDSDYGHDKAAAVKAARTPGETIVYVGDGTSDYAAAVAADRRFARKGRALERFLKARGVPFTAFGSFGEIARALLLGS